MNLSETAGNVGSLERRPFAILAIIYCIAWLPSIQKYIPYADETVFKKWPWYSPGGYLTSYLMENQLARVGSQWIVSVVLNCSEGATPRVISLGLGLIFAMSFFRLLRLFGVNRTGALATTCILTCSPVSFQCQLWFGCSTSFLTYTIYCLCLSHLLQRGPGCSIGEFVGLSGIAFLAQTIREDILACFCWIPMLVVVCDYKKLIELGPYRWCREHIMWIAPVLGALIFAILYVVSVKTGFGLSGRIIKEYDPQNVPRFNPRSLISAIWYQKYALESLGLLTSLVSWKSLFEIWTIWHTLVASLLGVLLCKIATRSIESADSPQRTTIDLGSRLATAVWAGTNVLAATAIHVVAGGYSLDSRKRLPILMAMALAISTVARSVGPFRSVRVRRAMLISVVTMGVVTTWHTTALYESEIRRFHSLAKQIGLEADQGIAVAVRWETSTQKGWSRFSPTEIIEGRRWWIINHAQLASGGRRPIMNDHASVVFAWDDERRDWRRVMIDGAPNRH